MLDARLAKVIGKYCEPNDLSKRLKPLFKDATGTSALSVTQLISALGENPYLGLVEGLKLFTHNRLVARDPDGAPNDMRPGSFEDACASIGESYSYDGQVSVLLAMGFGPYCKLGEDVLEKAKGNRMTGPTTPSSTPFKQSARKQAGGFTRDSAPDTPNAPSSGHSGTGTGESSARKPTGSSKKDSRSDKGAANKGGAKSKTGIKHKRSASNSSERSQNPRPSKSRNTKKTAAPDGTVKRGKLPKGIAACFDNAQKDFSAEDCIKALVPRVHRADDAKKPIREGGHALGWFCNTEPEALDDLFEDQPATADDRVTELEEEFETNSEMRDGFPFHQQPFVRPSDIQVNTNFGAPLKALTLGLWHRDHDTTNPVRSLPQTKNHTSTPVNELIECCMRTTALMELRGTGKGTDKSLGAHKTEMIVFETLNILSRTLYCIAAAGSGTLHPDPKKNPGLIPPKSENFDRWPLYLPHGFYVNEIAGVTPGLVLNQGFECPLRQAKKAADAPPAPPGKKEAPRTVITGYSFKSDLPKAGRSRRAPAADVHATVSNSATETEDDDEDVQEAQVEPL